MCVSEGGREGSGFLEVRGSVVSDFWNWGERELG